MNIETSIEKFGPYIASHVQTFKPAIAEYPSSPKLAITISHQAGAGAAEIAGQLAEELKDADQPWIVLDQQLIEQTLEKHGSPKELARKILEDRRFFVHELVDDLLDLQPPSWVLVPKVVETIIHLAKAGHVILVGHGATLVTASL